MDESIKCECRNTLFWFFGDFVRCTQCFNEIKQTKTGRKKLVELWLRRFNNETRQYDKNWEQWH